MTERNDAAALLREFQASGWSQRLLDEALAAEHQCNGYAGDPGASAPRCESYSGHPGRHFIRGTPLFTEAKR